MDDSEDRPHGHGIDAPCLLPLPLAEARDLSHWFSVHSVMANDQAKMPDVDLSRCSAAVPIRITFSTSVEPPST
jgi:hypothetical protein